MKKHKKNVAENGKGKRTKKTSKLIPKWDAEARAELFVSCTALPPAHKQKIIAQPNKGKMPAAKDKKGKCVMRGCL